MNEPLDPVSRRQAHVAAQHWEQPWQDITNAQPIPRRDHQIDCHVAVRAYLVWTDDGPETIDTIAYAWAPGPVRVLVQIDSTRYPVSGAWLHPWDVWPREGVGQPWRTTWGSQLEQPPWAG